MKCPVRCPLVIEQPGKSGETVLTADYAYFRLRKGDYSDVARAEIAERTGSLFEGRRDVYVYFKHEEDPNGALWAEELRRQFPG